MSRPTVNEMVCFQTKLQDLGFGSQYNEKCSLRSGDALIKGHFQIEWSDQRRIQAPFSLIRRDIKRN